MKPVIAIGWELTPEEVLTIPTNFAAKFITPYKNGNCIFGMIMTEGPTAYNPADLKLLPQETSQFQERIPCIQNREPKFFLYSIEEEELWSAIFPDGNR